MLGISSFVQQVLPSQERFKPTALVTHELPMLLTAPLPPVGFIYSLQHPVLKCSQFFFFFQDDRSGFTHTETKCQIYRFGSIPDEVIGFVNWPNPSSRTMALGLTQPLTEMSTRNLPGGVNDGRRVRLTT
jgi:hypothetical protein